MSINQRIKYLIDTLEKGVVSRFATKLGISHTTIASILPGSARESKPGFDVIEKILLAYPTISADWLVRGEGEAPKLDKPKSGGSNSVSNANNAFSVGGSVGGGPAPDSGELQYLKDRVRDLEQQLRDQIERNNSLVDKIIQLSSK